MTSPQYLGLDIGGSKTAVVVGGREGTFCDRMEFPTGAERSFAAVYREILDAVEAALARHPGVERLGVSIGGPLDARRGIVQSPPHLPGWDDVPLAEMLEQASGRPVRVMHDAKAGALAEWWFGAGRGCSNLVFLTLGTGLGAGVISEGRLLENIPGEVGHWGIGPDDGPWVYARRNAWEGMASGAGLRAHALQRYPEHFAASITAKHVLDAARAGGAEARQLVEAMAVHLGRGIAMLVDLLGPEKVVLGSLACRAGELFLPRTVEVFASEVHARLRPHTVVVAGELGESIGDYAALSAALYPRS